MEFLKEVFGDKALTYAELETALKDSKTVKLGNLASGAYVGKDKFDAEKTRADGLQTQLSDANKQIEGFKGMDIDGIKKAADEWKTKAETAETNAKAELEKLKFDHALTAQLSAAKVRNAKAVTALLDVDGMKLNADGDIVGLKEQLEKVKSENDYLFEPTTPAPRIVGPTGGTPPISDDAAIRAIMGLPEKN